MPCVSFYICDATVESDGLALLTVSLGFVLDEEELLILALLLNLGVSILVVQTMNSSSSNSTNSDSNSSNTNSGGVNRDLDPYFLELARLASSPTPTDMDKDEEAPTELNTINSSGGLILVALDKLSMKYTGRGLHSHDVGVAQANKPVPMKRLFYYFEIYVKDAGVKGHIAIGFTSENFKMQRQPG
ncbi:hypothetical protein SLEP1_g20638 [Rubroshorea leprosula]|uniref:Uncharacterized protein n=1 Tax=Rubroshorea leprosula TaxID=152421 RepID=A0AAV5JE10_9ROSI|nr:hypothetical protein SLEP1_g20638 [Rubroshorea leprosula]